MASWKLKPGGIVDSSGILFRWKETRVSVIHWNAIKQTSERCTVWNVIALSYDFARNLREWGKRLRISLANTWKLIRLINSGDVASFTLPLRTRDWLWLFVESLLYIILLFDLVSLICRMCRENCIIKFYRWKVRSIRSGYQLQRFLIFFFILKIFLK